MITRSLLLVGLMTAINLTSQCQERKKNPHHLSEPIVMDSASTVFIPVLYDASFFSSDKLATFGNYYANIIIYDFTTDKYHTLFPKDTYIESITPDYGYKTNSPTHHTTKGWVFYRVKSVDYTANGKIDGNDPFVLFVSTRTGSDLKRLTPENENVIGISFFEKLGFILVKIMRDSNGDRNFKDDDTSYYMKVDLKTLKVGNPIETKANTP